MFTIVETSDGSHIGEQLPFIDVGNLLTFADGSAHKIEHVFANDKQSIIKTKTNYMITVEENY